MKNKVTVRVTKSRNIPSVYVDGKKMPVFEDTGVAIPWHIIKQIEFKSLAGVEPIYIVFNGKNMKEYEKTFHLCHDLEIRFVLYVVDEITVEAFVTIIDQLEKEDHEKYQIMLYKVVNENPDLFTYENVQASFEKAIKMFAEVEKRKEKRKSIISYSPVGFVQFSVDIPGFLFEDVLLKIAKVIENLHIETNRRLALEEQDEETDE